MFIGFARLYNKWDSSNQRWEKPCLTIGIYNMKLMKTFSTETQCYEIKLPKQKRSFREMPWVTIIEVKIQSNSWYLKYRFYQRVNFDRKFSNIKLEKPWVNRLKQIIPKRLTWRKLAADRLILLANRRKKSLVFWSKTVVGFARNLKDFSSQSFANLIHLSTKKQFFRSFALK